MEEKTIGNIGIYKIENLANNKVYIGLSSNLNKRFYEHKRLLILNTHTNRYLQRSWNKYGQDNFIFEILEICNKDDLSNKEIYYIQKYDSFINGYNSTSGGLNNYKYNGKIKITMSKKIKGRKLSLETRKKMSDSKYNKGNMFSKKVIKMDMNGNIIIIYDYMNQINRIEGFETKSIRECCEGTNKNRKTAYGYIWLYLDNYSSNSFDIKEHLPRTLNAGKPISIFQYTLSGELVMEFSSIYNAEKCTGIKKQNIRQCINGKGKTAGGYVWVKSAYDCKLK